MNPVLEMVYNNIPPLGSAASLNTKTLLYFPIYFPTKIGICRDEKETPNPVKEND